MRPATNIPRFSLSRIEKLRDKLTNDALLGYHGYTLTGADFQQFVQVIAQTLPRVNYNTVFRSIQDLAGTRLTVSVIDAVAWRLAANTKLLQQKIAVPPWTMQEEPEWVPVQVLSLSPNPPRNGKRSNLVRLRVLAGTSCPLIFAANWSRAFCKMLARRVGYSAPWRSYPFTHDTELVNMRLVVQIDPQYCRPGQPGFRNVRMVGALLKWNRDIIKRRFRVGWSCPHGYRHRCARCPVGYCECPAATHRETYNTGDDDVSMASERNSTTRATGDVQPAAGSGVRGSRDDQASAGGVG